MSRYTDIYVGTGQPREELMRVLQAALGREFLQEPGGDPYLQLDSVDVYVGEHDLPDDELDIPGGQGIHLASDYPNSIEVRDTENDLQRQQAVAARIVDALKTVGRSKLVYIDDMQRVVDRFDPGPEAGQG